MIINFNIIRVIKFYIGVIRMYTCTRCEGSFKLPRLEGIGKVPICPFCGSVTILLVNQTNILSFDLRRD